MRARVCVCVCVWLGIVCLHYSHETANGLVSIMQLIDSVWSLCVSQVAQWLLLGMGIKLRFLVLLLVPFRMQALGPLFVRTFGSFMTKDLMTPHVVP